MSGEGTYRTVDLRASRADASVADAAPTDRSPVDPSLLDAVVDHLRQGGLIAYPTETVYGFGCALHSRALARLSELKERGEDAPFLLLIPDRGSVDDLRWTRRARELAAVFWPGALTLVLDDPEGAYPPAVRGPTGGVAVRRTPHPVARTLVESLGAPLTSTSANPPGGEPAADALAAATAARALGATEGELWIVDGGVLSPSRPSTIVDLSGEVPRVIREGAVPVQRLTCATVDSPGFWDATRPGAAAEDGS